MFRHLFKMIWNKKKQNALLISEMLISFLVLFAVFSLVVYNYQNYKKPMGFDYENVWVINYNNTVKTDNTDSLNLFYETLRQTIKSMQQVKEISFVNDNVPFSTNTNQSGFTHNKKHVDHLNYHLVEDGYSSVLNVKMLEGRWFNKQDIASANESIVINNSLKELIFKNENAVGKLMGNDDDKIKWKVVGVVEDLKDKGDYASGGIAIYHRADTGSFHSFGKILVNVTPNADATFESHLYKTVANAMPDSNVEIGHLTDMRKNINYFALVPLIVLLIVAGFLMVNVALGLFGVLWYNINKRKGEIGLRRAVGATGKSVSSQLVFESLILATFSLIIGSFFAIQFPLMNVFDLPSSVYITAIFLAMIFVYLLVLICSLYPGKQAAAIYPAVALHEE